MSAILRRSFENSVDHNLDVFAFLDENMDITYMPKGIIFSNFDVSYASFHS